MEGSNQSEGRRARVRATLVSTAPIVKRILSIVMPALLLLIVALAVLSVNSFPIIGDDSVTYLDHSRNLSEGGLVQYGYRQIGYPLFLAATRFLGNAVSAEPLLSMAVLQRLLLIVSAWLAWRNWRWLSLPLIAFLVASETLAFTNFLLTESLALPIAVLLVFPTLRLLKILSADGRSGHDHRMADLWGVIVVAGVIGLYLLRFTYAVFGAIPLVLAIAGWRTHLRRLTLAMLGVTVLVMGVFSLATSSENQREHDVFFPTASGLPVEYYFAWHQVFDLHPENRSNPRLAEFFDQGFVHDFSREVDAMGLSAEERQIIYKAEIEAMLDTAGISVTGSKVRSFLAGLTGGRFNDLRPALLAAVSSRRLDVESVIYINRHARRNGPERFAIEYNDGELAEVVITDPIGKPAPVAPVSELMAWIVPISLGVMLVGLGFHTTRAFSSIGLLVVVAFAAGLGYIRADNLRFLMPTSAFGVTVATGVASIMTRGALDWRRRRLLSGNTVDHDQREDGVLAPQ